MIFKITLLRIVRNYFKFIFLLDKKVILIFNNSNIHVRDSNLIKITIFKTTISKKMIFMIQTKL
jgi:hypothetical protein